MMLKTIPLLAFGLLTFTDIQTAQAGFLSKCTSAVGKKGGAEAYKCVNMSDPQEDPNFFKSFLENHCEGRIKPADKRACRIAQNKSEEELTEEHVNTHDYDDEDEEEYQPMQRRYR